MLGAGRRHLRGFIAVAASSFGFDPRSAGARRLLRTAQAAAPVEVVLTDAGHIIDSHIYGRGEIVSVSEAYARQLVDHSLARYLQG